MSKVIVSFANPIGKLRLVGSGGSNPIVLSPPPPLVLSLSKDVLSSRTSPWSCMLAWRLHRVAETCDTRVVREFRHARRGVRRRTPRERLEPRHGGGRPSTGSGRTGREAIRLTGIGVQAGIQSAGRRPSARFRIRERRRSPSRRSMSTRPPERHPGLSCHPGERWSLHNPRHPGERRDPVESSHLDTHGMPAFAGTTAGVEPIVATAPSTSPGIRRGDGARTLTVTPSPTSHFVPSPAQAEPVEAGVGRVPHGRHSGASRGGASTGSA